MTIDIVIVNYNVKHFLGQCLESVFASNTSLPDTPEPISIKVHVVDNASVDGSVEMVRGRFPQVSLTANKENVGFAAANNQALREILADDEQSETTGNRYALLLNPDTIVERDTLVKCVAFFREHPDCGGLGVKMINGEGKYLKESKRGFPSPEASFFKISGLIHLFPHNKRIAAYYMGHLPDDETNPVDILPGAFLMVSLPALRATGLLDEKYFMYGEDIDFSWRIRLAGYQNYYLPSARIIHYKGESTKHASINYVYTFYNAMSIFVQQYFSGKGAILFNLLLRTAIWTRATLAFLKRILSSLALPVFDFFLAYAGFLAIEHYWSINFQPYYPAVYTTVVIPLYILTMMACSWLYGGYLKPIRIQRIIKGMAVGTALLLLFYSLLDESLRYSRALLLIGCFWTLLSAILSRTLISFIKGERRNKRPRHCLIVGSPTECNRVTTLYNTIGIHHHFSTFNDALSPSKLSDVIHYNKIDEVIFCNNDHTIQDVIDAITALAQNPSFHGRQIEFKTLPATADTIIGSHQIHTVEDLYTEELNTIATPLNKRNKRLLDIFTSLILLIFSPILIWFQDCKSKYYPTVWNVLTGRQTWVEAPPRGVFSPVLALPSCNRNLSPDAERRIILRYRHNYRLATDIIIIFRNILHVTDHRPMNNNQ